MELYVVVDVNQTYCGDQFIIYTYVIIMLYAQN